MAVPSHLAAEPQGMKVQPWQGTHKFCCNGRCGPPSDPAENSCRPQRMLLTSLQSRIPGLHSWHGAAQLRGGLDVVLVRTLATPSPLYSSVPGSLRTSASAARGLLPGLSKSHPLPRLMLGPDIGVTFFAAGIIT